jgi:hypothetical protein
VPKVTRACLGLDECSLGCRRRYGAGLFQRAAKLT